MVQIERFYDSLGRIKRFDQRNYELTDDSLWLESPIVSREPNTYNYNQHNIKIYRNRRTTTLLLQENLLAKKHERSSGAYDLYEFDKMGYVTQRVILDDFGSYSYKATYSYQYDGGNLTKETIQFYNVGSDGRIDDRVVTITYDYYETISTIGNYNRGELFYGKSSKNLVKRENISNGIFRTYDYELYPNGNVKIKRGYNEKGVIDEVYLFEYY
jgi:hypothetical protein